MSTSISNQIENHLAGLRSAKTKVPGNEEEAVDLYSTIDMHVGRLRELRTHPEATAVDKGLIDSALQSIAGSRNTTFDIAR